MKFWKEQHWLEGVCIFFCLQINILFVFIIFGSIELIIVTTIVKIQLEFCGKYERDGNNIKKTIWNLKKYQGLENENLNEMD